MKAVIAHAWAAGLLAALAAPAGAQERAGPESGGPELIGGVFEHGSNFHPLGSRFTLPKLPPGQFYEDSGEDGTVDLQIGYRTAPLRRIPLKPRLTTKAQVSTAGRTSFLSFGSEFRQHVFGGRLYGQAGIGITIHDGYRFTPDPIVPGLSPAEAQRRYDIYFRRVGFGSRVLFNPNASVGVRLSPRWAAEVAWEHFSHRQIFSDRNPGIDHLGVRLVRMLGR